jgi:hypothetical protein
VQVACPSIDYRDIPKAPRKVGTLRKDVIKMARAMRTVKVDAEVMQEWEWYG